MPYPRRGVPGVRRFLPSWKVVLGAAVLSVLALAGAFGAAYALTDVPEENEEATAQASIVSWADGSEMGRFGVTNREAVDVTALPEHVTHAVLAAEDRSFYENSGVSPRAIVRSAWNNVRSDATQGGSTITQQYVKNVYLTQDRTLERKAREFFIALKVDNERSKDEILEGYLNTIYWGRSSYGIETAAKAYFGVPARDLTVAQAAYLAGIIQSPGSYDPAEDPAKAQGRWARVLDAMVEEGWLTPEQRAAQRFPELVEQRRTNRFSGTTGYLLEQVRRELRSKGFTDAEIEGGGLRVRTTFDRRAQRDAVEAVREELPDDVPDDVDLHAALVAVRPGDGGVVAMYGGEDYLEKQYDDAIQGATQPGSTFKPFALAAALEDGISLDTRFDGSNGRSFEEYEDGRPIPNFGGADYGYVDLVTATENSVNTVYVDLGLEVGPDKVMEAAVDAGIPARTPDLNGYPSNVLGVANVHPVDLAEAYATFAAQGVHADWYTVAEVRSPEGEVLLKGRGARTQAFSPDAMADLTYALSQVVEDGSGATAQEIDRPAAGKTGTTNGGRSAWFAGYVPQLATVVAMWDGDEDPSLDGVGGRSSITGGSFPTSIWTAFMEAALDDLDLPEEDFPERADVGDDDRSTVPVVPEEPVAEPTEEPTEETSPTEEPTEGPTEGPTEEASPTEEPSGEPTPSEEPSPRESPEASPSPSRPAGDGDDDSAGDGDDDSGGNDDGAVAVPATPPGRAAGAP